MFPNTRFDKVTFKTRLEFTIRQWHIAGNFFLQSFGKDRMPEVCATFFGSSITALWQNRFKDCHIHGIDNSDTYKTFAQFITLGINQINDNIKNIYETNTNSISVIVKIDQLIKERIESITDEIEEFLNATNTDEIKTINPNG